MKPNRFPLRSCPLQRLPPGSITAQGWLKTQLAMQLNGLNGRLEEISAFLNYDECGWVDPHKVGWEELPYWLRGYADLAFLTGEANALAVTKKWIDAILNSQQADGWFGPNLLRKSLHEGPDLWPSMPLINVLRSFFEYSSDPRVLPFLLNFFRFISNQSNEVFTRGWGFTRWSDNIDSIIWLYNRTTDTDWLLDLIERIHLHAANWMNELPTKHNVNLSQGFREPALYSLLKDEGTSQPFVEATYRHFRTIMNEFGQFPGGGFAGDENCREGFTDPRQGFETCGIVELMHSCSILHRLTGDRPWADHCETLAFNSLPAALDPFFARSTHYITCANAIQLDDHLKTKEQFDNRFPMLAYLPGVYQYRCCAHNHGCGWPYFTEELWSATSDNGLCASMYSPCQVTALVGSPTVRQVTIREDTNYPFDGTINFHFQMSTPVQFKLHLRIPQWCQQPIELCFNGQTMAHQRGSDDASFLVIDQLWHDGDLLSFQLPMSIQTNTWLRNHNSLSIFYGPLAFSLAIDEQWTRIGGKTDWPEYAVLPQSPWNYAILPSTRSEWIIQRNDPNAHDVNPFTSSTVPLEMYVRGRRLPQWQADEQNVIGVLPMSPVQSDEPDQTIKLIPMGAARLRITAFPTGQ